MELLDHARWDVGRLAQDPQADHAPRMVACAAGTYHIDGVPPFESFEVTTGECNFMSASQPLAQALPQGASLELIVWHLDLDASLPGPGHAAISIDGDVLWEVTVDIPNKAQLYNTMVLTPRDYAMGATIVFHVHNHGTNEWNIQSLMLRAAP